MSTATKAKQRPTLRRRPVKPAATPILKPGMQVPTNRRFIFRAEVLEKIGNVTAVSLWRWMKSGKFPPPVVCGGQNAWIESEIDQWMAERPIRDVYVKKARR